MCLRAIITILLFRIDDRFYDTFYYRRVLEKTYNNIMYYITLSLYYYTADCQRPVFYHNILFTISLTRYVFDFMSVRRCVWDLVLKLNRFPRHTKLKQTQAAESDVKYENLSNLDFTNIIIIILHTPYNKVITINEAMIIHNNTSHYLFRS